MPDPTLQEIADKVDDVTRLLTRQTTTLARIAEQQPSSATADGPLLVELHALLVTALTCAATARTRREREAFDAIAGGLERLVVGRGGAVVAPSTGEPFSGSTMEAVEVVAATDPECDRTVARLVAPGLLIGGRSARPARVAVHRVRAVPAGAHP